MIKLIKHKKTKDQQILSGTGRIETVEGGVILHFPAPDKRKPSYVVLMDHDSIAEMLRESNKITPHPAEVDRADPEFEDQAKERASILLDTTPENENDAKKLLHAINELMSELHIDVKGDIDPLYGAIDEVRHRYRDQNNALWQKRNKLRQDLVRFIENEH